MKEKEGVYKRYAVLEDVGGEDGRIHMNHAKLDLDIIKDVDPSFGFIITKHSLFQNLSLSVFILNI